MGRQGASVPLHCFARFAGGLAPSDLMSILLCAESCKCVCLCFFLTFGGTRGAPEMSPFCGHFWLWLESTAVAPLPSVCTDVHDALLVVSFSFPFLVRVCFFVLFFFLPHHQQQQQQLHLITLFHFIILQLRIPARLLLMPEWR